MMMRIRSGNTWVGSALTAIAVLAGLGLAYAYEPRAAWLFSLLLFVVSLTILLWRRER